MFLGKKTDWTVGPRSSLHCKKLLVSTGTTPGVDKIPTQEKNENALEGNNELDKKIVRLGALN